MYIDAVEKKIKSQKPKRRTNIQSEKKKTDNEKPKYFTNEANESQENN